MSRFDVLHMIKRRAEAAALPLYLQRHNELSMIAQIARFKGIDRVWASIVLGIAAGLVMLDRFFGFSTAWVRYISTELHLRQILDEFRLDWETA